MPSMLELYEYTKELSLLYVEDEPTLLLQMQEVFGELFKSVDTAKNGEDGVHAFKKRFKQKNKPYDLVITDINMPIMNGIEMVKEIYKMIPHQPMIITSAHSDTEYLIPLLNLGVHGFLIKPLDISHIAENLYTTAKFIVNEQLIKKHYQEIKSLNKELRTKTIALEQSLRIIEGMHHKHQIHTTYTVEIPMQARNIQSKETPPKEQSKVAQCLEKIEFILCNISMKYHLNGMKSELLAELSIEIENYNTLIEDNQKYSHLKDSLKRLSDTVSQRPKCTKDKELSRIFTIFESFFYIYTKWQNEWPNIDDENFSLSCKSIEHEIETLISLWTCRV